MKTLVISDETHVELTKVKGELMAETGKANLTYDEVIMKLSVSKESEALNMESESVEEIPHGFCTAFFQDEIIVFKNFYCWWCGHRWKNRYKAFIPANYRCPLCKKRMFWEFEEVVKCSKVSILKECNLSTDYWGT